MVQPGGAKRLTVLMSSLYSMITDTLMLLLQTVFILSAKISLKSSNVQGR